MSVLFALGMRPFYLLAGAFAAVAVALRALQYTGWTPQTDAYWHAHEMVFGFAFAVIAGFLLTAVRNWTQRETAVGAGLAALTALWILGRIVALLSLTAAVALDVLFALGLAFAIGRPLVASGNKRNWFFIALVLAIGAASVAFLMKPRLGLGIGLDIVLFIMAVLGGRVIPMFTNNAVPGCGASGNPWVERLAIGSLIGILLCDVLSLETVASFVALVASIAHGIRFALWRPWKTVRKPILWILHASYGWIVVHLALRALAGLDVVSPSLATHALTVGAIGGLTLGMMTRTARGHTGRPLVASGAEAAAYVLVQAAALARVLIPLFAPSLYLWSVAVAATLWTAAFALFTITFVPILARPRADGLPG